MRIHRTGDFCSITTRGTQGSRIAAKVRDYGQRLLSRALALLPPKAYEPMSRLYKTTEQELLLQYDLPMFVAVPQNQIQASHPTVTCHVSLAMPLVLSRSVDDFDGLERNEDGDYEDGYLRIQAGELFEVLNLKSMPGHRGNRWSSELCGCVYR